MYHDTAEIKCNKMKAIAVRNERLEKRSVAAGEHALQFGSEHVEKVEPGRLSFKQEDFASEHLGASKRCVALLKQPPTMTERYKLFLHDQHASQRCCVFAKIENCELHPASFPTLQEIPFDG